MRQIKFRNCIKKVLVVAFCVLFLCPIVVVEAKDDVKITDKEYLVNINKAVTLYMSNEKAVNLQVGSKMFLTYTVDKVMQLDSYQNGVIGTKDRTARYPYVQDGKMDYSTKNILFDEGYTYVFQFIRTQDGYDYQCAKLKGDEAIQINFPSATLPAGSTEYLYYGIWLDCMEGNVSAILNHVRCYDEKGNNLGIAFSEKTGITNELLDIHYPIGSNYSFTLEDDHTIAISNKIPTKSDIVYMEYEVENVTRDDTYQHGVINSWRPEDDYPFGEYNGYCKLQVLEKDSSDKPLLKEGGKYFICFMKDAEDFDAIVQCTVNGKTETFTFSGATGIYDDSYEYFSVWLGESVESKISATFKNVKCYDKDGNSLGIQLNQESIPVSHTGEHDNYEDCVAVYYCKDTQGFIVLQNQELASVKIGAVEQECSYKIMDNVNLYLNFKEGKETYVYSTLKITDSDGNVYSRLRPTKVKFVTGEEQFVQDIVAENGFRALEPEAPKKKGNTFKGWFRSDGSAYDFEEVVTESITLYAKWQDGDGNEYLAVDSEINEIDTALVVAIIVSAVLVVGSTVGCILIVRRKRNGSI